MSSDQQDALLYMPGATEGTTQWKVDRLQMLRWGGFHGHSVVDFAPTVTLLSGASGTGKSTLLDSYIALMMDSGTAFNGASNDATVGRARGADQRSLVSYLRGKMDTNRDTSTGALEDSVLRGQDAPTWGALAVTFVDDRDRRFTVARIYYVPLSATKDGDITRKMCTIEGGIHLPDLEQLAAGKFDKRSLEGRFTNLKVHDTYAAFSQAFSTRLGIGAHGEPDNALRLLARIQAGHSVRTVDDLYKSLVLETPATYAAADAAVEHFKDLEESYDAMDDEAKKADVLAPIPGLWEEREQARSRVRLIDTFGLAQPTGDTPFTLWQLHTEDGLLEAAEDALGEQRRITEQHRTEAEVRETSLEGQRSELEASLNANEANTALKRLDEDLKNLAFDHQSAKIVRANFDRETGRLGHAVLTEDDFNTVHQAANTFLAGFDDQHMTATDAREQLARRAFRPHDDRAALLDEAKNLAGREGRMDPDLHDVRVEIAHAAGIPVNRLPFVGELVNIRADESKWRTAIETTLFGIARIMLVDERDLDRVSTIIDSMRLKKRISFDGVELSTFEPLNLDARYISGKLEFKDTEFTNWILDRITADNTDALCVDSPSQLSGHGLRVTVHGQTRRGKSGAHGGSLRRHVIGFSNTERLAEIKVEVAQIEVVLGQLLEEKRVLDGRISSLIGDKSAHEHVRNTTWRAIDADGIHDQILSLTEKRDQILAANDTLRALTSELERVTTALKKATGDVQAAVRQLDQIESDRNRIVDRKDKVLTNLQRIERDQRIELTDDNRAYLDTEYAQVATVGDLAAFPDGALRLKKRLGEQLRTANDKVNDKTRALESIFKRYLDRWEDPDLSASIENYTSFRRILDTIIATGLADRREQWANNLTNWSGQDLVPLAGAFSMAIEEIKKRLTPINQILEGLAFSPRRDRLRIDLRELHRDDIIKFRRELNRLSGTNTEEFTPEQVENWFKSLRRFMAHIRKDSTAKNTRDYYLDVNKHIEITAVAYDPTTMIDRSTYAALGGKSGGETQELVAFIVGAALRFQLGDDANVRPRFAPVFLDEGFVKADSEFAGRAIKAWKGLGFQLIVGAPYGQFTALEPHADRILYMSKTPKGHSHVKAVEPTTRPATPTVVRREESA